MSRLMAFLVVCTQQFWKLRNGGNEWSGWVSYLSFFREVARLGLPVYEKWQHYEDAAVHGGPRFMHEKFWIVSDRPECIHRDERNMLHCETGPAKRWRDGWELYYIHGVRVPRVVVMDPQSLDPKRVMAEPNAEIRRVMIERVGMEWILRELKAKMFHRDSTGRLYRLEIPGDEAIVAVRVKDSSTDREYWLRVPPQITRARDAVAWTFDVKPEEYRPAVES